MSTRIVSRRRPASPLRVPTAQVAATNNIAVDDRTTTTTTVDEFDPHSIRSAPIPIPKSAHMNYRARIARMEDMLAQRHLWALNARINTTTDDAAAAAAATTSNQPSNTIPANAASNSQAIASARALLSNLTPLTPIREATNTADQTTAPARPALSPNPATAPTAQSPPSRPYPTSHYNGYIPVVYGNGRRATWVLAPTEPDKKAEPTPAQQRLAALARAYDKAVPGFWARMMGAERKAGRSKGGVDAEVEDEADVEVGISGRRDSGFFEGSGEAGEGEGRCVCSKAAGFWSEVRCGRWCELV